MAIRIRRSLDVGNGNVLQDVFVVLTYHVLHNGRSRRKLEEQVDYNGMQCERWATPTVSAYRVWGTNDAHDRLATLDVVTSVEIIPAADVCSQVMRRDKRTIDRTGQTPR